MRFPAPMSNQAYPVTVAGKRPDGSIEQVRVGTATKTADGFSLKLGDLTIGAQPAAAERSQFEAPPTRKQGGFGNLTFPNYGRSKGMPVVGATMQDLEYYANG